MDNQDIQLPKRILRRKFRRPALPNGYIPSEKTCRLAGKPLIWRACLLTSPTGYGKTAMLSYWYSQLEKTPRIAPLWISLDDSDQDISLLIKGIAYAFCTPHPEFREIVESTELHEKTLLIELCNSIDEFCDLNTTYVIFFDNYDAAAAGAFDDALLFINDNTNDNIKFIIAGSFRSRRLDDLLLSSPVMEVTQTDYEMNDDELLAHIRSLMPQYEEAQAKIMRNAFGAWPLPYSFAALAMSRYNEASQVRAALDGYLNRHFSATVIDRVEPATLEFMLETSILESMTPDICDAIRNSANALAILQQLHTSGLYCYYDKATREYRYEPLLRRFLLLRLLAEKPELLGELARRAMDWYLNHDKDALYVKYAAVTSDPFYLASTTESCTGKSLGNPETLTERFLLTPANDFAQNPALTWAAVWGLIAIGAVEKAEEWMTFIPDSDNSKTQAASRYVYAIGRALEGNPNESRSIIKDIFAAEGSKLPRELQCLLTHMEGEDCERLGNPKQGRELYQKALSLAKRTGTFYRLFDLYLLAHQHMLLGNFEAARKYATQGMSECIESMPILGEFNAIIANCLIERAEIRDAETYLENALKKAAPQANADMYLDTSICAARFQRAQGNTSEALQIMTDALKNVKSVRVPRNLDISAHTLRLSLAMELGETSPLLESEQVIEEFGADCDVLRSAPAMLAQARLHIYRGDTDEAFKTIERSKQLCQLADSRYFKAMLLIVESACLSASGHTDRALPLMTQAVEIASKGGYIMVFAEGGGFARDTLMHIASKQKISTTIRTHANKILSRLHPGAARKGSNAMLEGSVLSSNTLTTREEEILELLIKGMTRFEIANYLQLSQNTVKSHLKNIYSKLGAHSREDVFRIYQERANEK